MRIKIFPALIAMLFILPLTCAAEGEASFNVATYNLRQQNNSDSAKGNGWTRRVPQIANIIKFHGFDIFGTQEGFKNQLDDLQSRLPGYNHIGVGREDGVNKGEHSAIFYRTDLFEVVDHGDFWLSETPDKPSKGWDAVLPAYAHGPISNIFPREKNSFSSIYTWTM